MAFPSPRPFHSVSSSSDQEALLYNLFLRLLAQPPQGFAWCPCSTSGLCIPPQCASTLLPFVSSIALHCLERKSKFFSSTVTPHRTPSPPFSSPSILSSHPASVPFLQTGLALHASDYFFIQHSA